MTLKRFTMKSWLWILPVAAIVLVLFSTNAFAATESGGSADISKAVISTAQSTYTYTGSKIKPAVIVEYDGATLKSGTDYKVTYSANSDIGIATYTVTGLGKYTGQTSGNFEICLGSPVVSKSTTYKKNTVSWDRVTGATGYIVYRSTTQTGTYAKVKTITSGKTVSYTESVGFGSTYYYKVKAYMALSDVTYYSKVSSPLKVVNRLATPVVYDGDRMAATWINVYFMPVSKADGYVIYRSTSKTGKFTKVGTFVPTTKWAYLDKKLKKNRYYYYKVRAYKIVKGKKVYSLASEAFRAEKWKQSRLYYLFPDGVPTSESAMKKYLTTVTFPIINSSGKRTTMSLTVHKKIASKVKAAFTEIADAGFRIRTSDTGSYNWRKMTTGGLYSHHSYGCAIDINWDSNPFVYYGKDAYAAGYRPGVDRYSVTDEVVQIWAKYGFTWGGSWGTYKDYMHFSYSGH